MTSSNSDLAKELREHLRRRRAAPDRHPAPQELVDYHENRQPPAKDEAIREHLVDCEECSSLLLELEGLKGTGGPTGTNVSAFETAAAWRRLRARLFGKERHAPSRWAWGMAAAFALTSLGLGVWTAALHRTVAELRAPQLDLPIVGLEPVSSVRAAEDLTEVALDATAVRWGLILHLVGGPEYPSYKLEFLASGGRLLSTQSGLRRSAKGDFRLSLPRDFLPPGEYRILLYGARGDATELIEEYALRIVQPSG